MIALKLWGESKRSAKVNMFCIKCGASNSETANFCRKCGGTIEAEDETQVAVRPAAAVSVRADPEIVRQSDQRAAPGIEVQLVDPDEPIFSIGPTLLFVKIGYVLAAVGAFLLVAILASLYAFIGVPAWISIPLGLLLFLIPAFYHIKAMLVRYKLIGSQIEIDSGLIARTTRNVPLRRIQDVTVTTSIAQRLLGFGDLVIDNASEEGGKVVLKNINTPKKYADMMLKEMHRLDE